MKIRKRRMRAGRQWRRLRRRCSGGGGNIEGGIPNSSLDSLTFTLLVEMNLRKDRLAATVVTAATTAGMATWRRWRRWKQ